MSQEPAVPRRVRVTGPRSTTGRPRRLSARYEIDAQTRVGEVYMRSLMRSQLRLALGIMTLLGASVASLPAIWELFPWLRSVHLLGVPLPWLLLAFLVYPCLVALGWLYVRQAERNEQAFADLVDPK
jgi:hypothetical protein